MTAIVSVGWDNREFRVKAALEPRPRPINIIGADCLHVLSMKYGPVSKLDLCVTGSIRSGRPNRSDIAASGLFQFLLGSFFF